MIASIDLSMRSAGIVILDAKGNLMDQLVVSTKKEEFDEDDLLLYMEHRVKEFLHKYRADLSAVVMEGLAFGAKSGSADLIAGNWWNLRKEIYEDFPTVAIGKVPVTSWRAKVIRPPDKKRLQDEYGKLYLKEGCVEKLPPDVKKVFLHYLEINKMKASSIYDLADAYHLGIYRLGLELKK